MTGYVFMSLTEEIRFLPKYSQFDFYIDRMETASYVVGEYDV